MAEENIKRKAFGGVLWSYANTFGVQLLQLIPAMVLARLLSPSEYGLIAVSAILTGFVQIFVNCGFSMALIQKKDATHIDICSVFYFNIVASIVIYLFLFCVAPFVSDFFRQPEVCTIMRVSSFSMVIGAVGAVHNTLFAKKLEYRKPTIRNLIVTALSAVVAIILAYMGYGYWALVIQGVLSTSLMTVFNWTMSSWRPTLEFSMQSLRGLFGFGSKLLGKSLTDYGFGKLYDLVIGRFYTPVDLSYFNRANSTQSIFTDTFLMVMNSVAFASFSKMQDDFQRMRTNVLRFFKIEIMIISFIMLLIICLAEPIFHFMYSSKWDAVIPMFRIVCVWGLFRPISAVFANGLMAHGDSGACFRNSIIGRSLNVLFLLVTWKFGIMVMIMGQVLAYLIEIFLYTFSFNNVFTYSTWDMVKDIVPYYAVSGCLCACIWGFDHFVMTNVMAWVDTEILNALLRLLICGLGGVFVYIQIHKRLQMKAYVDFREIVLDATKSRPGVNRVATALL